MKDKEKPLVSIFVITYNSENTVIETLDSIKAQTYPNIELIISDDGSKDNTVELCREWIVGNKERFVRVDIVTVPQNTGVSANWNRAENVCQGEWIKGIAGDDILLPSCVQDCMDYVSVHREVIFLFGRCKAFGADEERCKQVDEVFDYSFFYKTPEQQLRQLILGDNCVPATTVFYNREKSQSLGIKVDERIPMLEDWPRWINLLRAGVKLHFMDKVIVKYRVGGISTTQQFETPAIFRSRRLMYFLYLFPDRYKEDPEGTIMDIINEECLIYNYYYSQSHSWAFKIGNIFMKPFKALRHSLGKV